jgi:hypothetical protein
MAAIMELPMEDFDRSDLIARLEADLPRLPVLDDVTVAHFSAQRLRHSQIVWTNDRWLLERGVDMSLPNVRAEVEAWLLDEFGFAIPLSSDPIDAFMDESRIFHADRYGGGNGSARHGGSGRVGTIGAFQVKGIGATPLVGDIDNWNYSHGCLWLEEGIREAICSEIAAAEFPHGAVPVVAIIDTGLAYLFEDGRIGERRALLVRPFVFRPAHMERAAMFAKSDETRQAQLVDARRVKESVCIFTSDGPARNTLGIKVNTLEELVCNVAEQIAFGQVHRLFHGGYFSSNLGINGELHDFGSFRSLPDWGRSFAMDHIPPFGDEMRSLGQIIESLVFHIGKHCIAQETKPKKASLIALATDAIEREFANQVLALWDLTPEQGSSAKTLIDQTRAYYYAQQARLRSYAQGREQQGEWIYSCLTQDTVDESLMHTEQIWIDQIDRALRESFGMDDQTRLLAWATASRLLAPRYFLFREILQNQIFAMIGSDATIATNATTVAKFIDFIVSKSRRCWPMLPKNVQVRAQVSEAGSVALSCVRDRRAYIWIEGFQVKDHWLVFGVKIPISALKSYECIFSGARIGALIPVREAVSNDSPNKIDIAHVEVEIPEFIYIYAETLNSRISQPSERVLDFV